MREADDLSEVEVAAQARLWNRRLSRAFAASVICSAAIALAVGVAANHITGRWVAAPLSAVAAAALSLAAARRLVLRPALARATRRSGLTPERQAQLRAYLADHPELRAVHYWLQRAQRADTTSAQSHDAAPPPPPSLA